MNEKTKAIIAENKRQAELAKTQPQKITQYGIGQDMIQKDVVYDCGIHCVDDQKVNDVNAELYERLYIQDGMLRSLKYAYPNNGQECPECDSIWFHNHGM